MIEQKRLMQIIDKFVESRLTEMSLESEGFKLVLKSHTGIQTEIPIEPAGGTTAQTASLPSGNESNPDPVENTTGSADSDLETISSPIVGTFYRYPAPDAPPFVDLGTEVTAGTSLCIIEAMKIMNKLEADFNCKIVSILVESGTMVEYGTPLFEVKRL